ncbi:hypothetical protein EV14_0766 [Prochlorococcus sp. MIT 0703]|nr:hypothetical protein EV14_0766 [Prochlorococcus sp. MIT 0703]
MISTSKIVGWGNHCPASHNRLNKIEAKQPRSLLPQIKARDAF